MKLKGALDKIGGGGGGGAEDLTDMGPAWLRNYGPMIEKGFQFGSQLLGVFMLNRQQPGATGMPGIPGGMPQNFNMAPGMGMGGPTNTAPQQAMGLPAPAPPQSSAPMDPQVFQLLSNIAPYLMSHLTLKMTGTDFAGWFMDELGEQTYNTVASFGPEQILGALYTHPHIAPPLQAFNQPGVVQMFIEEFCNPQFEDPGNVEDDVEPVPGKPEPEGADIKITATTPKPIPIS